MPSQPIKLYRLWCGKKRYTHWLTDRREIWRIALREGLACGSAWKKDPVSGVIGVQKGPLISVV